MPFQTPTGGQYPGQPANPGIEEDSDDLEQARQGFAKHDVLKWQSHGTWVEGVVIDFSDEMPKRDPVTRQQATYEGRPKYQDVITLLVTNAQAVCSPKGSTPETIVPVTPGQVVNEYVTGHNKYDPERPAEYGLSWRVAKQALGRVLRVGDLVRIDFLATLNRTWDGRPLGLPKHVKGYQVVAPSTPEEFALVEKAREMRRAIKAGQPSPSSSAAPAPGAGNAGQRASGFAQPTQQAAPAAAPTPAAPAARGLFD